jgi:hypothetical protein
MKIDRVSVSGPPKPRRSERSAAVKPGGFAKALSGGATTPNPISEAVPLTPVGSLFSIQEVGDAVSGRSRGLSRGHDLLDGLEALRRNLVLGSLTASQIEQLKSLAAGARGSADDPILAEILNEIEIRAAVELAKLGR